MGRYLIVDHEEKTGAQIVETLKSIDAQSQIEIFLSIADFEARCAALTPEVSPTFWTFDLMILDYSLYAPNLWSEKIQKLKALNQKQVSVIMVSYENNFTALKYTRPLDIYNFVFKPLDTLILKESLNLALKIKQKATPVEMKSQSASAFIAILKQVELQTISELGFVTTSDTEIEINSLAKYFSPLFIYGKKQSIWAQCLVSVPHPQKPGLFLNKFQYFGAETPFLNTVRRYVAAHKADQSASSLWNFKPPPRTQPLKMAIIGLESEDASKFADEVASRYNNLTYEIVKLDPTKKSADKAVYNFHFCINMTDIKFENYQEMFNNTCVHFWFPPVVPKEDDLKNLAAQYRDIFPRPWDRSYFFKKLKVHINALSEKDQNHLLSAHSRESLKVASKVKISEISELYVNLIYTRELAFKEFREFVFIGEDETQTVELPAFCHYTEKAASSGAKDDPGGFLHQFVFFSMTDHLLKQIRLWLLHNYIISNKKD